MKRIVNTISEALLLSSLIALFAIPVIVFGGFSPTTTAPKVSGIPQEGPKVLGVQTSRDEVTEVDYSVELMPSTIDSIQVEEIGKQASAYKLRVLIGANENNPQPENLVRIVNTSDFPQKVTLSLPDYSDAEHLKHIKLQLDSSHIDLAYLIQEPALEPAITLQPNEWLNIGVLVDADLKEPSTFILQADFIGK